MTDRDKLEDWRQRPWAIALLILLAIAFGIQIVLAGFALLNDKSHTGDKVDRNVAEFFVLRKYRGSGIATAAAEATPEIRAAEATPETCAAGDGRDADDADDANAGAGALAAEPNVRGACGRTGTIGATRSRLASPSTQVPQQSKTPRHAARRSLVQPDVFVHRQFRPAGREIVSRRWRRAIGGVWYGRARVQRWRD